MNRFLLLVTTALMLPAPALAKTTVTYQTTLPCAVACPSWTTLDDGGRASCRREPATVPGSWDEIRVTVPEGAHTFRAAIEPAHTGYEGYICRVIDPGLPTERYEHANTLAYLLCGDCREASATVPVVAGEVYVVRVYNFADLPTCPGSYEFFFGENGSGR